MNQTPQPAQVDIKQEDHQLVFTFSGDLTMSTIARVWKQCLKAQKKNSDTSLTLDMSQVTRCDEAGINLLITLQRQNKKTLAPSKLIGLSSEAEQLYQFISNLPTLKKPIKKATLLYTDFGRYIMNIFGDLKANVKMLGEFIVQSCVALRHPKLIRWRDAWYLTQQSGPNALGIIALVGFLLGLILAFQAAIALKVFGAEIYVANLVGVSLFRELGPLMTAIVVLGRTASAFAAELGTMKTNQEIDALKTMGLSATHFLVIPRLIACITMVPILTLFMIIFGLIGCGLVMASLGFNTPIYVSQLESAITLSILFSGLIKSIFFGILIAGVGCSYGLRTKKNAMGVGESTTRTVVSGIVLLAILDGVFAVIYYALGV